MIIFDNHLHLRRDGRFLDAIKDFQKAGGTHCILCQYPMAGFVLKDKNYKRCYQETFLMADEIRAKTDVEVFCTIGPYPVDYLQLHKHLDRDQAINIMKAGMKLAAQYCEEGKAVAIGEIGRPHFPIEPSLFNDSNEILFYGMQQAHEVGVPVVLHTESTTPQQCKELAEMGKKAGLKPHEIVKHYAPPLILEQENHGLMPSVLASKKNITSAIQKGTRFFMETDYIDDPKRPGAVLGPKTVPKRTHELLANDLAMEKDIFRIHKINPEKTYHITIEA